MVPRKAILVLQRCRIGVVSELWRPEPGFMWRLYGPSAETSATSVLRLFLKFPDAGAKWIRAQSISWFSIFHVLRCYRFPSKTLDFADDCWNPSQDSLCTRTDRLEGKEAGHLAGFE